MNFDVLKFLTPYSLCVSAPLRVSVAGRSPINHPAIMQRQISHCQDLRTAHGKRTTEDAENTEE